MKYINGRQVSYKVFAETLLGDRDRFIMALGNERLRWEQTHPRDFSQPTEDAFHAQLLDWAGTDSKDYSYAYSPNAGYEDMDVPYLRKLRERFYHAIHRSRNLHERRILIWDIKQLNDLLFRKECKQCGEYHTLKGCLLLG